MTFVKTKLRIERMAPGEILEVRLKGQEPLINVPKSLQELGHEIISTIREADQGEWGIHRITVMKK